MKNKTYFVALLVFLLGTILLLGSSYSLIVGNLISDDTYGFDVANFDVQFQDNQKISLSGIPENDEDGLKNSKEISFVITNNSDYDVNYRLDIIENSSIQMQNVIRYAYSLNNQKYSDIIALKDNYTIKQNKVLRKGEKDSYKLKMWLSLDADELFMNKTFSANISLIATQNEYKYATTVIERLAINKQDSVRLVDNSYRYSIKDAPNYLWFNCRDGFSKGDDYCEKWRIIGSFKNKKENSIDEYYSLKIVNTNTIDEIEFNNKNKNGEYDDSYIETFLNGAYYDKLNNQAKEYILKAKWNIGSTSGISYQKSLEEEKRKDYYGNVGLVNVSDYLYLNQESFITNNTVFLNKNALDVNVLNDTLTTDNSNRLYSFLPCVFLRPDVSIISGNGTDNNPYELLIKYPMNY